MPTAAAKRINHPNPSEASAILRELRQAQDSLQVYFAELEKVLGQPALDAGALTSVRLKLAGIRLTHGSLITRVSDLLAGSATQAEEAMLEQFRTSHQQLLQVATAHTAKWTLEAIARNWCEYRRETRELVRRWVTKAERDQRLVYPLVERCAGPR